MSSQYESLAGSSAPSSLTYPTDREFVVHGGRVKYVHNIDKDYHTNRVVTSQYTWWNFLPKNIFIQFCNRANLYFLIIGIFQCIPMVSTTNGIPTMYNPLLCVITVGAIRAAMEDRARHIADAERNHAKFWRISSAADRAKVSREQHSGLIESLSEDYDVYPEISWVSCGGKIHHLDRISLLPGEEPSVPSSSASSPLTSPTLAAEEEGWFWSRSKKTAPTASSSLLAHTSHPTGKARQEKYIPEALGHREKLIQENSGLGVVNSGDLKVGSLIKIYKNQMIPCDMVILGTSEQRGHCFIDKANLNGETTLEVVSAPPALRPYITADGSLLRQLVVHAVYEAPSSNFERFRCNLHITPTSADDAPFSIAITHKQLLLRETIVRNSEWVYGLAVYTGDDSKIRRSIAEGEAAPVKVSRVMRLVDKFVTTMFFLQFILCIVGGVYNGYWRYTKGADHWYFLQENTLRETVFTAIAATFSWMILLSTIVPISLVVSAQMCKFAQSWFIEWDLSMFSEDVGKSAKCNTSAIHDDLGVVDFIFSDKTGTLTQNKMEFRYGVIAIREHEQRPSLTTYTNNNTNTTVSIATTAADGATTVVNGKPTADQLRAEEEKRALEPSPSSIKVAKGYPTLKHSVSSLCVIPEPASGLATFGSVDTDIARAVKQKLAQQAMENQSETTGTGTGLGMSATTSSRKKNLELYPSTCPLAYKGLPPRWTTQILPFVKPVRATSAPVDDADLRSGMSLALAQQKARLLMLRGGWAGRGFWSRIWHSSQGRFFAPYIHAKRAWAKYKKTAAAQKYHHALKRHAQIDIGSSPPRLPGATQYSLGSGFLPRNGSFQNPDPQDREPEEVTELARAYSNDYATSLLCGSMSSPTTMEMTQIPEDIDPVSYGYIPAVTDEKSDISTSGNENNTELSEFRKQLDRDLSVPSSFLGGFGSSERTRILSVLWGPNWGDTTHPRATRIAVMRYMRNLALSSTVKPFRKPDGSLDWQFESAEELAMIRFAAACGFVRDNHHSGNGTVLYIREYTTPALVTESSRIHTECYNNIATLGFTSKRARVTVIWQRQPYKHAFEMSVGDTGEQLEVPLEGVRTSSLPSVYLADYDAEYERRRAGSGDPVHMVAGGVSVMCKGQDAVMLPLIMDGASRATASTSTSTSTSDAADTPDAVREKEDSDASVAYDDPHHPLQEQLREMASNGLRVLLGAYADLPAEWWACLEQDYSALVTLDDEMTLDHLLAYSQDAHDDECFSPSFSSTASTPTLHASASTSTSLNYQTMSNMTLSIPRAHTNTTAHTRTSSDAGVLSPSATMDLSRVLSSPRSAQISISSPLLLSLLSRLHSSRSTSLSSAAITVKELRHALYQHIEQSSGLALMGCIAMEDKLQPLVPETIRDFGRAGIRVWMITGDKLDTARNIALACELVDADMVMSQQQLAHTTGVTSSALTGAMDQKHSPQVGTTPASPSSRLFAFTSALPLAVRASRGKRLVEITAEWLELCLREPGVLGQVYDLLDEHRSSSLTLGFLQRCLLAMGVEVTLAQLTLILSPTHAPLCPTPLHVRPEMVITRVDFISALHAIAESLSLADAVHTDIEQGIDTYTSTPRDKPLSLLVNRDAFTVLFPPPAPTSSSKTKKKKASKSELTSPVVSSPLLSPTSPSSSHASSASSTTSHSPLTSSLSPSPTFSCTLNARFFALASLCKSVVFARAEPVMKKRMVTSIASLFPSAVTLAIGDGANDTEMITAASVGIGLAGVEGTAASNIADYALCSFRMLHTLLFAHGTKAYACISKLVVMMFYKASLLAWANFVFGISSCFSGQQWYNDSLYQLYNIIYTAWPVLIVGTLDAPLPTAVLENSPAVYRSVRGTLFSGRIFVSWMLRSLLHSLYVYYLPWAVIVMDGNDIMGGSTLMRGKTFAFWYTSTMQLCVLSVLPNLMALYLMEYVTLIHWVAVLGSSLLIFWAIAMLSLLSVFNADIYGFTQVIFTDPLFWLQFLILLLLPLLVEAAGRYIYMQVHGPTLVQVLKERVYLRDRLYWSLASATQQHPLQDPLADHAHAYTAGGGSSSGGSDGDGVSEEDRRTRSPRSQPLLAEAHTPRTRTHTATCSSSHTRTPPSTRALTGTPADAEPCWAVQLLGPDPDPSAVESCELFGEAAGWGVRATVTEEALVAHLHTDRYRRITREAEKVLRNTVLPGTWYTPGHNEGAFGAWSEVADRATAAKVVRAFVMVRQAGHEGGFHSAADQKHSKRDRFVASAGGNVKPRKLK